MPVPVEEELSPETDAEEVDGGELAVLKKLVLELLARHDLHALTLQCRESARKGMATTADTIM